MCRLLLREFLLVLTLDDKDFYSSAWTLDVGSAFVFVLGFRGADDRG